MSVETKLSRGTKRTDEEVDGCQGARTILKARLYLYRNVAIQPTPRYNENAPIGIHYKKKKKNYTLKNNEKPVNIDRRHF